MNPTQPLIVHSSQRLKATWGFPGGLMVKNLPAVQEMQVWSLGQEDGNLEKETATCSNILAWEIPRTEEPGGLQSTEFQRVKRDLATEHKSHTAWRQVLLGLHRIWSKKKKERCSLLTPCSHLLVYVTFLALWAFKFAISVFSHIWINEMVRIPGLKTSVALKVRTKTCLGIWMSPGLLEVV